jgi:hypothetical protein
MKATILQSLLISVGCDERRHPDHSHPVLDDPRQLTRRPDLDGISKNRVLWVQPLSTLATLDAGSAMTDDTHVVVVIEAVLDHAIGDGRRIVYSRCCRATTDCLIVVCKTHRATGPWGPEAATSNHPPYTNATQAIPSSTRAQIISVKNLTGYWPNTCARASCTPLASRCAKTRKPSRLISAAIRRQPAAPPPATVGRVR